MKKCIAIQVFGKVQGVWYRASTKNKAVALGITGTVRNRKDGSVYIEAEGGDAQLSKLLAWCKEGPLFAKVDRLEDQSMDIQDFTSFEIIR